MTGGAQSCRNDKPSINYRYNPHGGASFDLADVTREDYAPSSHDNGKHPAKQAEARSSILSTADLISGAGQLWNFASSSLPVLRHKSTSTQNNDSLQKENTFYYPAEEGNIIASISSEGQNVSVNLKADSHVSPTVNVQKDSDSVCVAKKHSSFDCCSVSRSCLLTAYGKTILSCKEKGVSSVMTSYELRNIYGWMSNVKLLSPMYNVNSIEHDKKRTDYCFNARETASVERSNPENTRLDDGMITKTELAETEESSSREYANNMMKTSTGVMSLCSEYLLRPIQDVEADGNGSIVPTSNLQADSNMKSLGLGTSPYLECRHGKEDELSEIKEGQERQVVKQESSAMQIFSLTPYKLQYGLAKQEHAFAGAFAGIFVSLCLHPMDTVKTVVQSCRTDQRSIQYIGKSILHERGLSGLYRGIASNIVSSAPISAIYTFSYESVKGALLPLFTKEYHSLAHCMAGGCASVATSFVFTPSERIKQQMQVGSHYHSCWNALLGIVGKGGFSSLYNGWGAVLCRNVPHSIIKFYTYESLKNMMFSSHQAHAQPTTILTLLCGGLAGSTAALFTTPFDVVKTRLQTQVPGSVNRYHGVFSTLKDISRHEGLKGLYRGLSPRLAMYMTQGALFFASYESFKRFQSHI
ncbi:uncharacterized protein LOC112521418 isoform X2 [Cynara cardunculus var. scolymus]|uniref:uncharacterized protein LOC112521418 isoform X2 n=1 Tax=Cynara cardunculus var. scolymus TaxID=59895 RepID=UPI000D62A28B|nr:uncharacterized protein LOC112521418 isoform X2 [Cynara cardunculus var. scolymus]